MIKQLMECEEENNNGQVCLSWVGHERDGEGAQNREKRKSLLVFFV